MNVRRLLRPRVSLRRVAEAVDMFLTAAAVVAAVAEATRAAEATAPIDSHLVSSLGARGPTAVSGPVFYLDDGPDSLP